MRTDIMQHVQSGIEELLLRKPSGGPFRHRQRRDRNSGDGIAMGCHEFWCTYYYRSSLDHALYELGQGGCALVFHTRDHYISILDISDDGNNVLVSNSYGEWYDIPTGWITVDYLRTRYYKSYDDALIIYLSYHISDYIKYQLNSYYYSIGSDWAVHNTDENIC